MPSPTRNRAAGLFERVAADRWLLATGWLIVALEAAFAIYRFKPWVIGDSTHYLLLAQSLADGRYGTVTAAGFEPDALRPPGYPIVLWFLLHFLGLPALGVVIVQVVAYCACLFGIQKLVFARGGDALFILVTALYPFPLFYSTYLLTESWAIVATTAAALLILHRSRWNYAFAGLAAGIGALVRADLLLLPLVLTVIVFIRDARRGQGWPAAAADALLPSLISALLILPYAAWNDAHFGRFSPTPMAGAIGTSLYLSTWQDQLSWDDVEALEQGRITPHMEAIGLAPAVRQLNRGIGAPENILAFDPHAYPTVELRIAAAQAFKGAALDRVCANPIHYADHVLYNLWALWVTKRYAGLPAVIAAGLMISSGLVFVLGLGGMAVSLFRPGAPLPWVLVPVTLYPAGIHLWLHTEARYTAAARPLLIMFAAGFLIWLASVARGKARSDSEPRRSAE